LHFKFTAQQISRETKNHLYFAFQSAFMTDQNQHLDALNDIRQYMDKSSRFISLSGLSGIAAGVTAVVGAWYLGTKVECLLRGDCQFHSNFYSGDDNLQSVLLRVGLVTFIIACALTFLFTYMRSKKTNVPIWGYTARRVLINVIIPVAVGGLFIWRLMDFGLYGFIAPACLIFYGLGLINGSKYTFRELRYLGFCEVVLGVICLWMMSYGLYFWVVGFGVLHIIYGVIMWNRYERKEISG
jgi:ABC-type antimicrobial peptide transport system permease subunit